ncbi:hypothetical protein B0H10DRAFT_1965634 [Mycena sp. CBHHK59/15]|nr:hypothetical protein B0H10DRAFT_1965634 [Mycena sp. CBHHK59/15]
MINAASGNREKKWKRTAIGNVALLPKDGSNGGDFVLVQHWLNGGEMSEKRKDFASSPGLGDYATKQRCLEEPNLVFKKRGPESRAETKWESLFGTQIMELHLLYYFDQVFSLCHASPKVFILLSLQIRGAGVTYLPSLHFSNWTSGDLKGVGEDNEDLGQKILTFVSEVFCARDGEGWRHMRRPSLHSCLSDKSAGLVFNPSTTPPRRAACAQAHGEHISAGAGARAGKDEDESEVVILLNSRARRARRAECNQRKPSSAVGWMTRRRGESGDGGRPVRDVH